MITAPVNKIIPFSSVDGPGNRTAVFFQGFPGTCRKNTGIIFVDHVVDCHILCLHQLFQHLYRIEYNFIRHPLLQPCSNTVDLTDTVFMVDQLLLHDLFYTDITFIDIPDIHKAFNADYMRNFGKTVIDWDK